MTFFDKRMAIWWYQHHLALDVKASESQRLHVRKDGQVVAMPWPTSISFAVRGER